MPNNIVKSFAKKTGRPESEIEELWDKALDLAKKRGIPKKSEDFYAFIVGILKRMLKMESLLTDHPAAIVEGYMDGTRHRLRQTPINNTSKIFKRDSFIKRREDRDKKKKKPNRRPTINHVTGASRLEPTDK